MDNIKPAIKMSTSLAGGSTESLKTGVRKFLA